MANPVLSLKTSAEAALGILLDPGRGREREGSGATPTTAKCGIVQKKKVLNPFPWSLGLVPIATQTRGTHPSEGAAKRIYLGLNGGCSHLSFPPSFPSLDENPGK